MSYFHCSKILPLYVYDISNDCEESVIDCVKYRDKTNAIKTTVYVYEHMSRRKKHRMELAETKANECKTKRDNLENSKKKMYVLCKVTP